MGHMTRLAHGSIDGLDLSSGIDEITLTLRTGVCERSPDYTGNSSQLKMQSVCIKPMLGVNVVLRSLFRGAFRLEKRGRCAQR